jgi:hypothetical protein
MKTIILIIIPLIVLGLIPSINQALAAPSISSTSGTFAHGSQVIINGSQFGIKSQAQPISWDHFENQAAGNTVANAPPVVGTNWTLLRGFPGSDAIVFDKTRSISGTQSVKVSWLKESINAFGWANQGPYTQLYISYWRYQTGTYYQGVNNHKQFYVYGNSGQLPQLLNFIPGSDTRWGLGNNRQCNGGTYASENNLTDVTYNTSKDKWDRWEFWAKLNTVNTADGVVREWINGALKNNRIKYKHRCDGNTGEWIDFRLGHMFQGVGGGPPDALKEAWFDDVYIDNTLSRVEMCDVSNWNSRESVGGRCAIQVSSAWSDNSITATVNRAFFSSGQIVYLYVINQDRSVNQNGYPITLGSGQQQKSQVLTAVRRKRLEDYR